MSGLFFENLGYVSRLSGRIIYIFQDSALAVYWYFIHKSAIHVILKSFQNRFWGRILYAGMLFRSFFQYFCRSRLKWLNEVNYKVCKSIVFCHYSMAEFLSYLNCKQDDILKSNPAELSRLDDEATILEWSNNFGMAFNCWISIFT